MMRLLLRIGHALRGVWWEWRFGTGADGHLFRERDDGRLVCSCGAGTEPVWARWEDPT